MSIFFKDYPIYYINLQSRVDRNKYIIDHFTKNNIKNYYRVDANTPDSLLKKTIEVAKNLGATKYEIASSSSHIKAVKSFVENSDKEYGVFCEDDVDISNINKVNFSIDDLFLNFKLKVECFQLGVSTREDVSSNFKMRLRGPWDFNCSLYVMNRDYAKKILNNYTINNEYIFDNFIKKEILDYRSNSIITSTPVPEYIIYGLTDAITCPISTFEIFDSSMNFSDECYRQNIKSRNDFLSYWHNYDIIRIVDLL